MFVYPLCNLKKLQYVLCLYFFDLTGRGKKVVFIGMPGSGKSSTINILLGKEECETGLTFMKGGLTKTFQQYNSLKCKL